MARDSLPIKGFTGAALALALSLAQAQVHSSRSEHLLKELTATEASLAAARDLRKLGYTHLAAETFGPNMMSQGYVSYASGYYTRNPVYANFVRDAAKDGWKLVDYEHRPTDREADSKLPPDERQRQRESGQARNLLERILAKEPQAKIFIFAGYGHAQKSTTGSVPMMADYFKQMSKIDPLSIDQALMFPHVRAEAEHALYPALASKGASKGGGKPGVLRGADGTCQLFASPPGAYDMQVIHPALPLDPATGRGIEWQGCPNLAAPRRTRFRSR